MPRKKEHALKATLSVTLIVFISKAVGFIRDAITLNYFGTTAQSDAYVNAYGIYYIPILLLTSCITSTMVPLYLDAFGNGGPRRANRFASNCVNLFALFSMVISILMFALAGPLVRLVYPKLSPESARMTVEMTRVMMPSLVFVAVSIVQSSIMNARERYLAGQLSGFPYSIVTIIAAVCFSARYGIYAVAWATAIAGLLQMLVIIPFHRGVFKYSFRFDIQDARIRRMIVLAVPSMASMAVNELNHMIDRSIASGLNVGDVTAMNAAYRLITFIVGVVVVPITTVMFSRMSQKAAQSDRKAISDILMQCIEVISMILLPIIALGSVFGLDVIKLAYMRGEFNMQSAQNTAWILVMYLAGVIFYGLRDLFNRGFHALQNTRVPLYTSMLTVALNVVLNLILSRFMGAGGLALATSIASMVGVIALFVLLKRRLGRMHARATVIEIAKMLAGTGLTAALAMALNRFVPEATGTLQVFFRLLICGIPCLLVYFGALYALRTRQLSFLKDMIRR